MMRVTYCAFVLLTACAPPDFPTERPEEIAERTEATVLPEDLAIYEALIRDYARHGRILGLPPPMPQNRHPLSTAELKRSVERWNVHLFHRTDLPMAPAAAGDIWGDPSGQKIEGVLVPQSAVADLNRRNAESASLRHFRPRDFAFPFAENRDSTVRMVILSIPGYSLGRNAALVVVSDRCGDCVPFVGMTSEMVYLRKVAGEWRVVGEHARWIL
jgi:hypothetical protein